MRHHKRAWILEGLRTPIGSFKKTLKRVGPDRLAAHTIQAVVARAGVSGDVLDGIVLGHGYQSAYSPNTARCAALAAGVPATVPAATVQRQCGSGMEAVACVVKDVFLGNGDLYVAGGTESMSSVPYLVPADLRYSGPLSKYFPFGPRPVVFKMADDGLVPTPLLYDPKTTDMSYTAQRLADSFEISREDADRFALRSHELAVKARESGRFDREIEALSVKGKGVFARDEHPRSGTSYEKLASLRPAFKRKDVRDITAGNSSGINDGACALLIGSDEALERYGKEPLAEVIDCVSVGVDPYQMGLGPVEAINKLLERAQLETGDIDLFEINEAFAAQYLACEKLLGLDREKVNVNGGAIALGHPIGMSGARLLLTLAQELKERGLKRGVAALCVGGGMGIATLIEARK